MLFNSLIFIFFMITVLAAYYAFPHRFRWMTLLAASLIFYAAWDPRLLLLLLFSVLVNYTASLYIAYFTEKRKPVLIIAVIINIGILAVFKYAGLITSSLDFGEGLHIVLPMGISFYTFQAMGYTIDVYRGNAPERNFLKFTLFITFFPQLVAGPIERASNLMPQLFTRKSFNISNLSVGFQYMLLGFYKKIVIADRIAPAVNAVYNNPTRHTGLPSIIATLLFAFQIYCDFSGYSDIAIGCAKMLGIDLMENFKTPYLSSSIRNFWRRWHISLSGWFKDYLYFPLGGSRVSALRRFLNTMVTFLVSGLWHGASWTFVLWGAVHGLMQSLGGNINVFRIQTDGAPRKSNRVSNSLRVIRTFLLVCFGWIFFRANTISDAGYIAGHLLADAAQWTSLPYVYDIVNSLGIQLLELVISSAAIALLIGLELYSGERPVQKALAGAKPAVRWVIYSIITVAIVSAGVFEGAGKFIYFQF